MNTNLINEIKLEIERLQKEDISPAEHNGNKTHYDRIIKMAQRFKEYQQVLEKAIKENSVETIIKYSQEIFINIDWLSVETDATDNRLDSFKILIYILNLLTPIEQKRNYLELENSYQNSEKIINLINTKGI